jgi:D-beta-D-heptose 7-phosphate kinase/D-beta-D-heptose 1-phosphate adenosyltransferase
VYVVRDGQRPTTEKQRIIDHETGEQRIVLEEEERGDIPSDIAEKLLHEVRKTTADILVVSDYGRGVVTSEVAHGIAEFSWQSGKPLIVDGRERKLSWYQAAFPHLFLITPNQREAEAMLEETFKNDDDETHAGRKLRDALHCHVLLTLSERGARLFQSDGSDCRYPARDVKRECVSGAGDTLVATVALGMASRMSLEESCRIGQYSAGFTVSKSGTEVVDIGELREVLARG